MGLTLFLNAKDMNDNLDAICPEGETYKVKLWGLILAGTPAERLMLGTRVVQANVCCYFGVTEKHLVVAMMGTTAISTMQEKAVIPLDQVKPVRVRRGLMPGQKIVNIGAKPQTLKLSLMNKNPVTSTIKNQKEAIAAFCDLIQQ
jgi:hypothetical protein